MEVKSKIVIKDGLLTKTLVSGSSLWRNKFNIEKACYKVSKDSAIGVITPSLIDEGVDSITLTYIEGKEICEERYLENNIPTTLTENIVSNILKINQYKQPSAKVTDYKGKIERYCSNDLFNTEQKELLFSLLKGLKADEFNHGDMLLKNIIKTPDNKIAFIDWEFAGLYIKGYDLALLHTTITMDKASQRIIESKIKELSIEKEFWFNKAIIIAREVKVHNELPNKLNFKKERLLLLKEEENTCSLMLDKLS